MKDNTVLHVFVKFSGLDDIFSDLYEGMHGRLKLDRYLTAIKHMLYKTTPVCHFFL